MAAIDRIRIEIRTDGSWEELITFELTTPTDDKGTAYISHRRDPAENWPRSLTFDPNDAL